MKHARSLPQAPDRNPRNRRLLPPMRIAENSYLTRSAAGCALLLDSPEEAWGAAFAQDCGSENCGSKSDEAGAPREAAGRAFAERLRGFARLPSGELSAQPGTHVRHIGGGRGAGATKTLEARSAGVHDCYRKAIGRANKLDLGV